MINQCLNLTQVRGIIIYTDGVTEAVNPEHCFFGEQRLIDAVKTLIITENTAEGFVLGVSKAVGTFCAGNEPFDDMALMTIIHSATENE